MKYGLSAKTLSCINKVFLTQPKIDKVILYGSRAKGTHHEGSDIDLTLEGDKLELTDLYTVDEALDELNLPYSIDLSLYGQINNKSLIGHIERRGKIIYKQSFPLVRLDSLYQIARGGSPRPIKDFITNEPDGINWIKIGDATASGKYIYETKQKIIPAGIQRSRLVKEGDFILSNSMSFGRPYIMATSGCIHDGWLVLSAKDDSVDQDFLYYILGSPFVFKQFDALAAGSTVRNLNIGLVSGVKIPLFPINEQKRIVAILDQAFAEIERARANAQQNLNNARKLFESYLQQVFSQRGDGWVDKTMGEVCLKIQDGAHHSPKKLYQEQGDDQFLYITSKNIRNNYMDLSKIQYVDSDFHGTIYPRCTPELGDVLLTKDGANTGNVTLNTLDEPFSLLSSVCLMKVDKNALNSAFLKYYIQSPMGFEQMTGQMTGAAIKRIILRTIKASVIPIPPIGEQNLIVTKFDQLLKDVDKLENIYKHKITALDELKKSILQKAFSGELSKAVAA